MLHPVRPPQPISHHPAPVAAPRPSAGPSFAERLQTALRNPAAPVPADAKLGEVQHFAAETLGTEAWEARLVESYDMLSADEGLYEVQTSRGPYEVIRSRMGTLSIYQSP